MPWGKRPCSPPPHNRFWGKVEKSTGCWLYLGAVNMWGYGKFWAERKDVYAHQFSWKIHFGPIPKGKIVLHHCDNPRCVRPEHLYAGTPKDNAQDCIRRGRKKMRGHYAKTGETRRFPKVKKSAAGHVKEK